jgi:hypothetical protein
MLEMLEWRMDPITGSRRRLVRATRLALRRGGPH